ncbi:MAG TPA: phosphatidylglycerol lysyltransferase domain-containing protein [Mycobacteriales bacterium]|nr:phosphatidylglycerol lysyltransferase domain-containing protein [Mycobacteriales bacterium]
MTSSDIARWPSWSRLRFEHKPLLEALASPDPYCDWTFATLWSSDTEEEVALARLGAGIALRLPSYPPGGPEDFSLNGRPSAADVATFVAEHGTTSLVPKPVMDGLALSNCVAVDDRDQYDYVYDVAESLAMAGGRYQRLRGVVRKSRSRNPDASLGEVVLSDPGAVAELVEVFDDWATGREAKASVERRAFLRCLDIASVADLRCAVVGGPNGLLAFAILAPQANGWAVTPFAKTRRSCPDVGGLLWRAVLELGEAQGWRWFNYEQDLGLPGLRQYKRSLRPARMLEKVRLAPAAAE